MSPNFATDRLDAVRDLVISELAQAPNYVQPPPPVTVAGARAGPAPRWRQPASFQARRDSRCARQEHAFFVTGSLGDVEPSRRDGRTPLLLLWCQTLSSPPRESTTSSRRRCAHRPRQHQRRPRPRSSKNLTLEALSPHPHLGSQRSRLSHSRLLRAGPLF